jgi:Zn-dependent protease with chaperone function
MDAIYPANPSHIPADLSLQSPGIRRHVWLAVAGLLGFVIVYFALSAWFAWAAYHLLLGLDSHQTSLFTYVVGGSSGFLALFMIKALFFVKKGSMSKDFEVTAATEPQLFGFLNRLADETGAPRPHRVFLSPRVNACVFYDLSLLNFVFPSKKNLEIGLALVNVLTITELKAVLAHEFGHFAQRSMALGNWVYIAQQIAAHIIAKRDGLDKFLRFVSSVDLRVAWVGWILRLVVWSLRATMESIFTLVLLAQRALSREMEFQADLVAVSVTGSDALIHALHKLQAADEAWDDAQNFLGEQINAGKAPKDIFSIHLHVIDRIGKIINKPNYGSVAELPADNPQNHRVFTAEVAQPPRMWATHPYNHERENNAKKVYVSGVLDNRSSWIIFDDATALKEKFTANLLERFEVEFSPLDEVVANLDKKYAYEYLNSRYRGAYLGRSFVRHAAKPALFYQGQTESAITALGKLYPESLSQQLEQLRNLERERDLLVALRDGVYTPPDGIIRFRGNELKKRELPGVIENLRKECETAQHVIFDHDKQCRTAHKLAADELGQGWPAYLNGLLEVLHYADHMQANISDSRALLNNVYAIVTADRNVSSRELTRLIAASNEVFKALAIVYRDAEKVILDPQLLAQLEVESWSKGLGEFTFVAATKANINDWLNAHSSWVNSALNALSVLRRVSLEQLLVTEAQIAQWIQTPGSAVTPAPVASEVPTEYPTLTPGEERALQKRLDLWDRFQTADGVGAGLARFIVAGVVIGGALYITAATHWLLSLR